MSVPLRVAVLLGGSSEERGVALASGCEVAHALRSAGHDVVAIDSAGGPLAPGTERRIRETGIGQADVPMRAPRRAAALPDAEVIAGSRALAEADVVFLALHGGAGEDGTIQTLLEAAGIAYTGSGPVGCALAMDKDLTKRLLTGGGVATPGWATNPASAAGVVERLGLPVIVKPASGGSSVRLTLADSADAVAAAIGVAGGGGDAVLCEQYIAGREFTVGILEDATAERGEHAIGAAQGGTRASDRPEASALPVVEIEPARELFDFECKYRPGMAIETAPARIPNDLARALQETALRVHRILGLRHYSRVDFMVDDSGNAWCLEANSLPGMTSNSLLPKAARAAGMSFAGLCDRICRLGHREGPRARWKGQGAR